MNVIGPDGNALDGGFGLGCSHSGYERIVWDDQNNRYVTVCINDLPTDGENGKLALAPAAQTIMPVDLYYANVGDVIPDGNGAFWVALSDRADGEPESSDGAADVHLVRFNDSGVIDDINITMDQPLNSRAPHLSAFGENGLLVAWEQSSNPGNLSSWDAERKLHVQAFMKDTGAAIGDPLVIDGVLGNRYVSFRAFPDGSVAVPVGGESNTSVRILRILPCS